ncbi:MAG TPA: 3-phosphoshikimate 1-carboxyvinyltransferase [Vicinamibacterales bacterium]
MPPAQIVVVHPATAMRGRVRPPGDKSVSHRYALLAALAQGTSTITGYSTGADCASTLDCLRGLGVEIAEGPRDPAGRNLRITGRGLGGLKAPSAGLDAGNSGSTMRMLAGILAAHPFAATITGDESLQGRPMRRIIVPLERMGARIDSRNGRPPLTIHGTSTPAALDYQTEVPSAQVKSAVLLAGLHAEGRTSVRESVPTRDHTERALAEFGVRVERPGDNTVAVQGRQPLRGTQLAVPGDMSAAAFWLAAGASLLGSEIVMTNVGLNPTRTGVIDVVRRLGGRVDLGETRADHHGEPVGTVTVRYGGVGRAEVAPAEVPGVIDELPVLAALATHGGELKVTGAQELRVKESDRIAALADGIRRMGGEIEEFEDGFHVHGGRRLVGGVVDAKHDHRLAMAFAIAALGASGPTSIHGADAAAVSYPEFFGVLDSLRA